MTDRPKPPFAPPVSGSHGGPPVPSFGHRVSVMLLQQLPTILLGISLIMNSLADREFRSQPHTCQETTP